MNAQKVVQQSTITIALVAAAFCVSTATVAHSFQGNNGNGATPEDVEKAWAEAVKAAEEADKDKIPLAGLALELHKLAAEDAKAERRKIQQTIEELKKKNRTRNWIVKPFASERLNPPVHVGQFNMVAERFRRVQAIKTDIYANMPDRATIAVRRGHALNFFLNLCGAAAIEHTVLRDELMEKKQICDLQRKELELELRFGNHVDGAGQLQARFAEVDRRQKELQLRLEVLEELGSSDYIRKDILRHIRIYRGKLIVNLWGEPLPLHWPHLLRSNSDYSRAINSIERAREYALEDLRNKNLVSPSTATQLTEAADDIYSLFQQDWRAKVKDGPDAATLNEYIAAKSFVKGLRVSIGQFVDARELSDVQLSLEGDYTVEDLLAILTRQGLRFAEALTADTSAYYALFPHIVSYYHRLDTLSTLLQSDASEIENLTAWENDLRETQYRKTDEIVRGVLRRDPLEIRIRSQRDLPEKLESLGNAADSFSQVIDRFRDRGNENNNGT